MHKGAAIVLVSGQPCPPPESVDGVGGNGQAGLDLHGKQSVAQVDQTVQFMPRRVPPEEDGGLAADVLERLDDLSDDERLKDRSSERMPLQQRRAVDAQQVADQTGVEEVESRPLTQA